MVSRTKAGWVVFGVGFFIMWVIVAVDIYYSLMEFEIYLSYITATWQITNPATIIAGLMMIFGLFAVLSDRMIEP